LPQQRERRSIDRPAAPSRARHDPARLSPVEVEEDDLALQLIGAGFGRTGTLSLKVALEQLGFGPCHHMLEVMGKPEHVALWRAAAEGEAVDWEQVYDGYLATVDWPGCAFWRELADLYPEARVILTLRDAEQWYESTRTTIYEAMTRELPDDVPDWLGEQLAMTRKLVLEKTFAGRFEEPARAIEIYEQHNQSVQDTIAPERLLVMQVARGWAPLCDFLGCEAPDTPFPRLNEGDAFRARMGL